MTNIFLKVFLFIHCHGFINSLILLYLLNIYGRLYDRSLANLRVLIFFFKLIEIILKLVNPLLVLLIHLSWSLLIAFILFCSLDLLIICRNLLERLVIQIPKYLLKILLDILGFIILFKIFRIQFI